jgi:hypothetical protein
MRRNRPEFISGRFFMSDTELAEFSTAANKKMCYPKIKNGIGRN